MKTTNWCSESVDRFYGIMDKLHLKASHLFFKGIVQLKINSGCVSSLTQTLDKCVWVLTPLFGAHMHAAELVLPSPSFVPFVMSETQSWTLTAPLFKVWHDLIPFIKRGSWFHTHSFHKVHNHSPPNVHSLLHITVHLVLGLQFILFVFSHKLQCNSAFRVQNEHSSSTNCDWNLALVSK